MTSEPTDPTEGWYLIDWEDAELWDIIWDGELWMADRETNWDYENGRPLHVPEDAYIIESFQVPVQLLPGNEGMEYEPLLVP